MKTVLFLSVFIALALATKYQCNLGRNAIYKAPCAPGKPLESVLDFAAPGDGEVGFEDGGDSVSAKCGTEADALEYTFKKCEYVDKEGSWQEGWTVHGVKGQPVAFWGDCQCHPTWGTCDEDEDCCANKGVAKKDRKVSCTRPWYKSFFGQKICTGTPEKKEKKNKNQPGAVPVSTSNTQNMPNIKGPCYNGVQGACMDKNTPKNVAFCQAGFVPGCCPYGTAENYGPDDLCCPGAASNGPGAQPGAGAGAGAGAGQGQGPPPSVREMLAARGFKRCSKGEGFCLDTAQPAERALCHREFVSNHCYASQGFTNSQMCCLDN